MDVSNALKTIEMKYAFKFKEKQMESIKYIMEGKDTFIVLPTGYGKSKIYSHLPEIHGLVRDTPGTVLVISPLQSLMKDQVSKLNKIGISATLVGECQSDKNIADLIREGQYQLVFSSPEAALTPGFWRRCFTTGVFHDNLLAVVVDEAHCIIEWGDDFRPEYGNLAHLRSIVPDKTVFIAMTATSTKEMKRRIIKHLDMCQSETQTVCMLPERKNLTYVIKKSRKQTDELHWILADLIENKENAKKTIIYCRNIAACANLYEHFYINIDDALNFDSRLIAMFHRSTTEENKEQVLSEFPKQDSKLRLVFATVAFGMGVDIPDVENIVHWGAPRSLEQYSQESGRGGRDGRQCVCVLYFSGIDIAKDRSTDAMREFCRATGCIRKVLNDHFSLGTVREASNFEKDLCCCCSLCSEQCNCTNCFIPRCNVDFANVSKPVECDELAVRYLTNKQMKLLKLNLQDYQSVICEENPSNIHDFDCQLIEDIVSHSDTIMCIEDVIELGLSKHDYAEDILLLIEEIENL
ncbi:ATP-dependent DNA helicase RecQ [Mytilus galloprovincialis]|uniref:DNA 3'-5' helicase n=1 Tax=Mytilus galloprovincialis TaxID=29158 RepID=A0A8B6GV10_MYTGA|nr:ATP-dependent DNA helicase RecQ [Mytilus galloprovincialis]